VITDHGPDAFKISNPVIADGDVALRGQLLKAPRRGEAFGEQLQRGYGLPV